MNSECLTDAVIQTRRSRCPVTVGVWTAIPPVVALCPGAAIHGHAPRARLHPPPAGETDGDRSDCAFQPRPHTVSADMSSLEGDDKVKASSTTPRISTHQLYFRTHPGWQLVSPPTQITKNSCEHSLPHLSKPLLHCTPHTSKTFLLLTGSTYNSEMSYQAKTFTSKTEVKSSSPGQIFDKSGKKTTLLKDNSWIRKASTEDEVTEGSTNFGRAVLGRFKSQENLDRPPETTKASPVSQGSYVQSLTKRFSGSQDELAKSSGGSPTTDKTITNTKSTSSTIRSDLPKPPVPSMEKDGSKTTINTKTVSNGKTTETTVVTTRTSGFRSSPKSETVTDGASDTTTLVKGSSTVTSSKTTKTEVTPVTPTKEATDWNTVVTTTKTTKTEVAPVTPTKATADWTTVVSSRTTKTQVSPVTPSDRTTIVSTTKTTKTQEIPMKPSDRTFIESIIKTTKAEVDSLTPTRESADREYTRSISTEYTPRSSITTRTSYNTYSSSDYTPSTRITTTTYNTISSDTGYERSSSLSSPSVYSTKSYTSSRPDDYLSDSIISTSTKTLYSTLDRSVTEKDVCNYCRKPMNTDPKIVLGEMQINCHATCFKCEVCNGPLGHLKAGDTMWVYRRTVHCERCFSTARDKWRI
ncbi:flocculation protein FLO11-like isoform X2 [Arapaima gigas]